ncbi:hypothetical protein [Streptomyces sp. HB-N217]|nr:hypothetical protein [Streptomyces sp. HB-N217]
MQLGERVGRDHRTIHRWEYAQRNPRPRGPAAPGRRRRRPPG